MNRQQKKGFTLIELLVVISIIGFLSSVVLASLNSARDKAIDNKTIQSLVQLRSALELYYDQYGRYPADPIGTTHGASCWDCSGGGSIERDTGRLSALAPYLSTRPTSIVSGGTYVGYFYKVSASGRDYKLVLIEGFKDKNNIPLNMRDYTFYDYNKPFATIYSSDVSKDWYKMDDVSGS